MKRIRSCDAFRGRKDTPPALNGCRDGLLLCPEILTQFNYLLGGVGMPILEKVWLNEKQNAHRGCPNHLCDFAVLIGGSEFVSGPPATQLENPSMGIAV